MKRNSIPVSKPNQINPDKPIRQFKGVFIPADIWTSPELSLVEKVLLTEIISLEGPQGCYASNKYFADFLGRSKSRVPQIISSLKKKGFIQTKLKKIGKAISCRIIHTNRKKGGYLENYKGGYLENYTLIESTPKGVDEYIGISSKTFKFQTRKKRKLSKSSSSLFKKSKSSNIGSKNKSSNILQKQYIKLTSRLSEIISSHKKVNCKSNMTSWAQSIRLLIEKDLHMGDKSAFFKKEINRVNRALDYYESAIGDKYTPVILSGASLREKFIQLEGAMERAGVKPIEKEEPKRFKSRKRNKKSSNPLAGYSPDGCDVNDAECMLR